MSDIQQLGLWWGSCSSWEGANTRLTRKQKLTASAISQRRLFPAAKWFSLTVQSDISCRLEAMVILTGFLLRLGSAWMSFPFSMFCFLGGFVLSIQQWNELEWRMCLIVLVVFLCLILPGNRLQVKNSLLSSYIVAKMCVSSANAYSPCSL